MIVAEGLSRPALRRQLRQARRQLTPSQQRRAARALYRQLAQHPLFRRSRHIALYLPNDGEIDPRPLLLEAQKRGKATYLPVLNAWPRTRMVFQRIKPSESLRSNRFGIFEPASCPARQRRIWALDLILMPLVGFDEQGGRLGMGGGYYDATLQGLRAVVEKKILAVGYAFAVQQVAELPHAAHDERLDWAVTERGAVRFERRDV